MRIYIEGEGDVCVRVCFPVFARPRACVYLYDDSGEMGSKRYVEREGPPVNKPLLTECL